MHTILLAGGLGTRLYPVVKDIPKPMAPVNNKTFIEYLLDNFKKKGMDSFTICVCHLSEKLMDHLGNGDRLGVKISYSVEEKPLGTAGAIGLLRNTINETFCVTNADNYLEFSITDLVESHKASGAIATIAVIEVQNTSRYGRVEIDEKGYIKSFKEKAQDMAEAGYINTGIYIFEPEIFDYMQENKVLSLEKDVFPKLLKDSRKVNGYIEGKNFYDIGEPDDYYAFIEWNNNRNS